MDVCLYSMLDISSNVALLVLVLYCNQFPAKAYVMEQPILIVLSQLLRDLLSGSNFDRGLIVFSCGSCVILESSSEVIN